MKQKTVLLCLLLGLFFNGLSQSNHPLKITLEPSKSFGFVGWTAQNNSTYSLRITKKRLISGQVVYTPLYNFNPSTNFFKLDKTLLNQDGLYFSVAALDANGTVISETEPAEICPECTLENTWTCSKTCNGVDYAYTLNITAEDLGLGQTSMGRVWISNAYSTVAPNANAGNFYYEAMTPAQFALRSAEIASNNLDWYVMNDVLYTDQIRDAQNVVLTETVYFVQKTLGEFEWANGNRTTDYLVDQTSCSSLSGMINRMNQFPSPENNYTGILECFPAWPSQTGTGGGVVNKPYNGAGSLADALVTYFSFDLTIVDCYSGELSNELYMFYNCDDVVNGGLGVLPTPPDFGDGKLLYVKISNVNDPSVSMNVSPDQIFDYGKDYVAPILDMKSGLYRMTFVFDDFSAAQFLAEHNAETYVPITNSRFATLSVTPNPIENETLIYGVSVSRSMSFEAQVYSLDGELISTEEVKLKKDNSMHRAVSLSEDDYPYSQVRIKLVFADESFIEEIVSLSK